MLQTTVAAIHLRAGQVPRERKGGGGGGEVYEKDSGLAALLFGKGEGEKAVWLGTVDLYIRGEMI